MNLDALFVWITLVCLVAMVGAFAFLMITLALHILEKGFT